MGLQEDGEYPRVREHISKINFDTVQKNFYNKKFMR